MARSFNGSSDLINLGRPSALNFTGPFTLSIWANATALPANGTNYRVLVGKGYDGSKEQYVIRYAGVNLSGIDGGPGTQELQIFYFDGSAIHGVGWVYTNVTGTWYNIVGGWDGSTWFLYNNAVSVGATEGKTQIAPANATADFAIGGELISGSPSRFFNGSLAEVGAWNVALSASEIAALAKGYSPALIRTSALADYLPMVRDNISTKLGTATLTGTTIVPHPRIIMPRPQPQRLLHSAPAFKSAWAGGSNLPVLGTGTF